MTDIDQVIGRITFDIVERHLKSTAENERPFFRIKNLRTTEALALLDVWNDIAGKRLKTMKVVVAADSPEGFPSEFRADPEKSITYYRDTNELGLIYIETKVESDAQGLKNIFSLSDANFLDGEFDEEDYVVAERMVELAWQVAGGQGDFPLLLGKRICEVLKSLHPDQISISARRFISFALAVLRERQATIGVFSPEETDRLVGRHLPALNLFPDEHWRGNSNPSPTRMARRLGQNALHAELASSRSSDLDTDKLIEQIERTTFRPFNDGDFSASENDLWRSKCTRYCCAPDHENRVEIEYHIFEQLFGKDVKGLPLGDRIRGEIDSHAPERGREYDDLSISGGLSRRSQEEAQRFLEAEPDETRELRPLRDLLSKQTLRMVEKLANPNPERFSNPLIKFAEIAASLRTRISNKTDDLRLRIRPIIQDGGKNPMLGLFAFLYGETLREVACSSEDDANSITLIIDERLLDSTPPPPLITNDDVQDEESGPREPEWNALPFEFSLESVTNNKVLEIESGYEWEPESKERVILLWLGLVAKDTPAADKQLRLPDDSSLDDWISNVVDRSIRFDSAASDTPEPPTSGSVLDRIFQCRTAFMEKAAVDGISVTLIDNYFDTWSSLLMEARETHIPDGKRDSDLISLQHQDCVDIEGGGSILMLPSHPFRLRWFSRYLEKSAEVLTRSLVGDLPLNRQNNQKYLQWIADLSPQQQPAVHCNRAGEIVFATGALGMSEEFSPLEEGRVSAETGALEPTCTAEIAAQVHAYIEAHPYKKDGLSILVVLPSGAKLPGELVQQIRKGSGANVVIDVTVMAPRELWDLVSQTIEQVPTDNRLSNGHRLFPSIGLGFIHLDPSRSPEELFEGVVCDIAIVPKFLQDQVDIQQNTEPPNAINGCFDPLLDSPTHVYGGRNGGAISVSMRPSQTDPALNAWSTIVVRQHRARPVAPAQPENQDFVEMKINFERMARIFAEVHKISHWVVTLEKYISREQIENLEPRPDILTVRENVGSSGLYTLIVSSQQGRQFVIKRLKSKLGRIVEGAAEGSTDGKHLESLAARIYDETRLIAPRLALKAMGISRVTEEIVGLTIARHIAGAHFPSEPANGVVVWISLDDHPDWFQGSIAIRADLLRLTLRQEGAELFVDVLAVEGKLRQAYDPHGEDQVLATLDLIQDALSKPEDETQPLDAEFWREQLASAMEAVAPEARTLYGATSSTIDGERIKLPGEMRDRFRRGIFKTGVVQGLYSLCRHDIDGSVVIEPRGDSRLSVVRSFRNDVVRLVERTPAELFPASLLPESPEIGGIETLANSGGQPQPDVPAPMGGGSVRQIVKTTDEQEQSVVGKGKLDAKTLESRYQRMLDTFGTFNVDVRPPSDAPRFEEGPASVLYRLKPGLGVDPSKLNARADAMKLALELEESQSIRFSNHLGYCLLDVPKRDEDRYFISAGQIWKDWRRPEGSLEALLGVDRIGNPIGINFSSSDSPHLLIGGTTGSGKSEALNTILCGLVGHYTPDELRLALIDPKSTELFHFENAPHLDGEIGYEDSEAIAMLTEAVENMQARYRCFRDRRVRSITEYNAMVPAEKRMPWKLIVLDEYADLTSEKQAKEEIEAHLRRLAQKARAAGIHVIIATQNPKAEVISTNLRSNLPAQLALRVRSGIESQVIMGEAGAEALTGKGDAFLKAGSSVIRLQVAIAKECLFLTK
ncbi:DNA translocase FtsK [Luteolibacter yonseiensis]|uniref:DNA translocase FtsK n=1 Tax=Luteolibacter yonseiensis TaxID=1144680 RepID=A0A934R781_9BACT|nr:FtsK/SpoIIIE domain-containing protein [Luteolibacter yonseiensis]MBK1818264.1 DNA translocase FtsK [Luteolibacter yonseiensis]